MENAENSISKLLDFKKFRGRAPDSRLEGPASGARCIHPLYKNFS